METELERLVVRLVGDGSEYQKMINQAATSTTQAAEKVQQAASRIEGFQKSVQGFASAAAQALGAIGLGGGLRGALAAFSEEEDALITLRAALKANNQEVENNIAAYQEFAATIQDTTTYGDEYVYSLLSQAINLRAVGDASRRAVTDALALGAASRTSAESAMRMTAAMAQGDIQRAMQFARMIPALRGIRDEQEFVTRYQALVNAGTETLGERARTATGRIQQMKNAMGDLMEQIGAIVADAIKPFLDGMKQLAKVLQMMSQEAKQAIVWVSALVAGFLLLGPVISIVKALLAPFLSLAKAIAVVVVNALRIVVVTAVWTAWKLVVVSFNAVLILFKVSLALVTGLMSIHKVVALASAAAMAVWTGAIAAAKAAVLLLTGALAVLKVVLAPTFLIAATITATVLLPVITSLAAAVIAVGTAGNSLLSILREVPTASGPVTAISGMFSEWFEILKDVVGLLRTDMPKAWELLKAGFALAVSQLKDLWPPLWNFIKEGFVVVANAVGEIFILQWSKVQARMRNSMLPSFLQDSEASMQAMERGIDRSISSRLHLTGIQLNHLVGQFSATESQATQDARAEVARLRGEIDSALSQTPGENGPRNEMAGAVKEAQKFDAVLRGSAEAAARIGAYLEANAVPRSAAPNAAAFAPAAPALAAVGGALGGGVAGGVGGGVFGAANGAVIAQLLGQIARNTGVVAARPEINVEPIGLEEGA